MKRSIDELRCCDHKRELRQSSRSRSLSHLTSVPQTRSPPPPSDPSSTQRAHCARSPLEHGLIGRACTAEVKETIDRTRLETIGATADIASGAVEYARLAWARIRPDGAQGTPGEEGREKRSEANCGQSWQEEAAVIADLSSHSSRKSSSTTTCECCLLSCICASAVRQVRRSGSLSETRTQRPRSTSR